jgi:hypothetical protein
MMAHKRRCSSVISLTAWLISFHNSASEIGCHIQELPCRTMASTGLRPADNQKTENPPAATPAQRYFMSFSAFPRQHSFEHPTVAHRKSNSALLMPGASH